MVRLKEKEFLLGKVSFYCFLHLCVGTLGFRTALKGHLQKEMSSCGSASYLTEEILAKKNKEKRLQKENIGDTLNIGEDNGAGDIGSNKGIVFSVDDDDAVIVWKKVSVEVGEIIAMLSSSDEVSHNDQEAQKVDYSSVDNLNR